VVKALLGLCALISVATTVGIIAALFIPAFEFFQDVSIVDFLTETEWAPLFEPALFGVVPLIVGTLAVTFWAVLVAIPLGLGSAIYLSEYAGARMRSILKPMLELLAGIPTIVYGYFALTFFTPLLRDLGIGVDIFNVLSAGLVMGIRARCYPAGGGNPHRGAGGDLRSHRVVRARHLPRGRGNDDRARRGRPTAEPHLRPA
jgi:phosphate transport system permease protein